MSNKSAAKPLRVPRPMAELEKECHQKVLELGDLCYKIYVFQEEREKMKSRIKAINNEAAARKQLDTEQAVRDAALKSNAAEVILPSASQLEQSQAV